NLTVACWSDSLEPLVRPGIHPGGGHLVAEWFYRNPQSFTPLGPYDFAEMQAFVREGRIRADTPVRLGNRGTWTLPYVGDGLVDARTVRPGPKNESATTESQPDKETAPVIRPAVSPVANSDATETLSPATKKILIGCACVSCLLVGLALPALFSSPKQ